MSDNYAEQTGPATMAIHSSISIGFRLYEGICRLFAEYPDPWPENWQEEKRELAKLKIEMEEIIFKVQENGPHSIPEESALDAERNS